MILLKRTTKLIIGIGTFMVILLAVTYFVQKSTKSIIKSPIATVNGEVITKGELDENIEPIITEYKLSSGDKNWDTNPKNSKILKSEKEQELNKIINDKLLIQNAKATNSMPGDNDITKAVNNFYTSQLKQYNTEENLLRVLKTEGYTKDSYMNYIRNQILFDKLTALLMKDYKFDESLVQKEYDANKTILYTTNPSYADITYVIVPTEAEAKKIIEEINVKSNLATTTRKLNFNSKSTVIYNNSNNNSEKFEETFLQTALATAQGKVSEPFNTKDGWVIIECTKKEVLPPKSFEEVKADIRSKIYSVEYNKEIAVRLTNLRDASKDKIKIYSNNL